MRTSTSSRPLRRPLGILFDYGGTLVDEVAYDARAGMNVLLADIAPPAPSIPLDTLHARIERVTREVSARRDEFQIETPWPAVTRLVYEVFGVRFGHPLDQLELSFWDASVTTHPMRGVRDLLIAIREMGIPVGVVSNSSFRADVIRHELAKHRLAEFMSTIVASAEYAVRKPNPLLFEVAAARLGVPARDIWFVGDRLDTDIAGARAAAMFAVWYAPNGTSRAKADLVIATWSELLDAVRAAVPIFG